MDDVMKQPQTIGAMIDTFRQMYEERAELNIQVKDITQKMEALELSIIKNLDELGLESANGKFGKVRITENIIPSVKDWDAFYKYIRENDAFYLLQRRATMKAFNELLNAGETIPGVEPLTQRTISSSTI